MKTIDYQDPFDRAILDAMGITTPPKSKVLEKLKLMPEDIDKISEYKSSGYYKDAKLVRISTRNLNMLNLVSDNLKNAGFGNFSVSILANSFLERSLAVLSDKKKEP